MIGITRRRFGASALVLPAVSALAPGRGSAAGISPSRLFPRPEIIRYDAACFTIRGRDTFLYSLEFPYPRTPPAEWADRFAKIRQAGFNTVDTYVFWNYHEAADGRFDVSELDRFLVMAKQFGLYAIVRPGPYVDAEFERGGFPARVIAARAPLRGMHPVSLETSRQWYAAVLPVIRRHQITEGGPVILMQIENETDFTDVPEREQREYLRYLARLAWSGGIEVPLMSNVSSVVRDRSDADMARIMDVCDFYPRWAFLVDTELPKPTASMTMEEKVGLSDRAVLASIRKMRADQPDVPLSVAELGTGYYSKFGGKLSEDEEGADGTQINALVKTIVGAGVTYFNLYIGAGGSNFDWGAKGVTTTYDFAAPIREGGGLWDKYYEVRGIGALLRMFGPQLARSRALAAGFRSTHADMTVVQRVAGQSGFVFVRSNTEADHHYRLEFADPAGGPGFAVPRHGQLAIGPRAMTVLPVQVPISGGHLRYSTAELLAHGRVGDRDYLVVYDEPGRAVEVALAAKAPQTVTGDPVYTAWEPASATMILGLAIGDAPRAHLVGGALLIIALPRATALRSWAERAGPHDLTLLTDAYLVSDIAGDARRAKSTVDYRAGVHRLDILTPSKPVEVRIDGRAVAFEHDPETRLATLTVATPRAPVRAIIPTAMQVWTDASAIGGEWIAVAGTALDDHAPLPYGYVRYRTRLAYAGEDFLYLSAFGANPRRLFVNGVEVPAGSVPDRFVALPAAGVFKRGENLVEVIHEQFGSNEFGENARLTELNGIRSAVLGFRPDTTAPPTRWDVQIRPAPMQGRGIDPGFGFAGAHAVALTDIPAGGETAAAFTWCRTQFTIPDAPGWTIPWALEFVADRDALLYFNNRFLGRCVAAGPQFRFPLPAAYLRTGQPQELTIVLGYAGTARGIGTLRIVPQLDHAARRYAIELKY